MINWQLASSTHVSNLPSPSIIFATWRSLITHFDCQGFCDLNVAAFSIGPSSLAHHTSASLYCCVSPSLPLTITTIIIISIITTFSPSFRLSSCCCVSWLPTTTARSRFACSIYLEISAKHTEYKFCILKSKSRTSRC